MELYCRVQGLRMAFELSLRGFVREEKIRGGRDMSEAEKKRVYRLLIEEERLDWRRYHREAWARLEGYEDSDLAISVWAGYKAGLSLDVVCSSENILSASR